MLEVNSNHPGLVSVEANEVLLALQVCNDALPVIALSLPELVKASKPFFVFEKKIRTVQVSCLWRQTKLRLPSRSAMTHNQLQILHSFVRLAKASQTFLCW